MRSLTGIALIVAAFLVFCGAQPVRAVELKNLSVEPEVLEMSTFFTGGRVTVTGQIPAADDLLLSISGPAVNSRYDLIGRYGPFWMTRGQVELENAPNMYILLLPEGKDGEMSFAGLHDSFLNVTFPELLSSYKKVLAGMYNLAALEYRIKHHAPCTNMGMAVLYQKMVDSRTAGVIYTVDPSAPNFTARSCRTLHDVMHFIHEKSIHALAGIVHNPSTLVARGGKRLKRVGYHFTVVDAVLGMSGEKNKIFFRFVGGATGISRRSRRAALLVSIMEKYGFKDEG